MPFVEAGSVSVNFPFEPYECQVTYMKSVISCLQNGHNGLLESPTGTGKTLCLLCSSLAWLEDKKAQIQSRRWQDTEPRALQHLKTLLGNKLDEAAGAWNAELASPKIIYASRTHSQLSQAMQELKRTAYRHFNVSVLGSREQMCIHPHIMKQESNIAKVHLCRAKVNAHTCHFYNNVDAKKANFANQLMDIEDLVNMGKKHNCCPYYMARELKTDADVIFMPYNYLLDPKSRRAHGVELQGNIIIFDEAHNLASMCEDSASFDLTSNDIGSAIQELKDLSEKMTELIDNEEQSAQWGHEPDFNLSEDFNLKDVLEIKGQLHCLEQLLDRLSLPRNGDGITKPGRFIFELFGKMNVTFSNKMALADVLDKIVTYLNNETASSFHSRGAGLSKYADVIKIIFSQDVDGATDMCNHEASVSKYYKVHIKEQADKNSWKKKVTTWETSGAQPQKKGRVLSYWCFSSGHSMRNLMRQGVKSVILTSGTLAPLDSFMAEMDIEFKVQLENPHVIDRSQAWIGVVGKGPDGTLLNSSYAHRFKEEYKCSLGHAVVNFSRVVPAGMLVFFPSYPVMNECLETWEAKNIWRRIEQQKAIFVEPRGKMEFHTAIESYNNKIEDPTANGALFAAVCRGKVSEGLDFADNNGRAVIITGLPFPPLKDPRIMLKMQFLDEMLAREGRGLSGNKWYKQQASRAVNQAIGRVIRHRHDFGAILLCDNRFSLSETRDQLPAWIRPSLKVYKEFGVAMRDLILFFKENDALVPGKPSSKQRAVSAVCAGAEFQPTTSRTATSGQNCAVKASIVTTHVDSLIHQPAEDVTAASLTRQYKATEMSSSTRNRPTGLLDALANTEKSVQESRDDLFPLTPTQKTVVRGGILGPRGGILGPRGGILGPQGGILGPRGGILGPRKKKIVIKPSGGDPTEAFDKPKHNIQLYLAEVKQMLSKGSYRSFSTALRQYKTSNDYEALIGCIAAIFTDHPKNFQFFQRFYKFVRREDKPHFSKKCHELTGLKCGGLKLAGGTVEENGVVDILGELQKKRNLEPGQQPATKKLKTRGGVFNQRDVFLKPTDPPKKANMDRSRDQRLLPRCPVIARVNINSDVLPTACAASSGHLGLGESAGDRDKAAGVQSVTDMSLGSGATGSRFTGRSRSTEGQTTKEGSNAFPTADISTDGLPRYKTPGCSVDGALTLAANPDTLTANPDPLTPNPDTLMANPDTLMANPDTLADNTDTLDDTPITLMANHVTLMANPLILAANPDTLMANRVTMRANPVTLAANPVTLTANPVTLMANHVTLMANPVILVANPVTGDTGATAKRHSDAAASRPGDGGPCCYCKALAYIPLKARCQHICCLKCWKVCIDEFKKCPECGVKVKRKHLTRLVLHAGPDYHGV